MLTLSSASAIPRLRLEALHVTGVDDMSTQDIFGYFKEYPPAHIEWIDDASCERTNVCRTTGNPKRVLRFNHRFHPSGNVVWLDDDTSIRALINTSRMPDPEAVTTETGEQPGKESKGQRVETCSDFPRPQCSLGNGSICTQQLSEVQTQRMRKRRVRWAMKRTGQPEGAVKCRRSSSRRSAEHR